MSISGQAYALALLHAAAHPSSTVLGLLLGTAGPEVVVTDALPLIHRNAALSPTAELGLALARERAKGAKMTVVGIYVAQSEEGGLGRAGEALLKALKADVPGAVALLLDEKKLRTTDPVFTVHGGEKVTWPETSVRAGALRLVREERAHTTVRDLDDHLDDARVEWMDNAAARKAIATIV